ncbi:hypothetical protein SPRG_05156 [Saprolegnia parasitica CBS 223.65]|uniref:NADH-ubiquinone oxidoreductase 21kDa subunit N-terminal domain-containing protein n=1 Tax=Saprolegnia parasitica (strain CBS 223.65) TaxID=695850 RepID=A0A067CTU2_SAPPC|nr:hypothetical protein SPRG_05156 [Saprolegnia parasitica CBS 223.65]KDO29966.1 hypothetical protein SPRG_05156 [Saprolegnia parasitica CBS 223.65]|eukprot:XP_012199150.1 hypothetical protein SPRG_05156 [Saprolegnia parasitica CBS 223.65]
MLSDLFSGERKTPKPFVDPRLPQFPVIDANPPLQKILQATRPDDGLSFAFIVASMYIAGLKVPDKSVSALFRKRTAFGAAFAGALGGFAVVCQMGQARLQGFARNEVEIAKFGLATPSPAAPEESVVRA